MTHPKAETTFTGAWHGDVERRQNDAGDTEAVASATCDRCGALVEARSYSVDLAETLLSTRIVLHHCELLAVARQTRHRMASVFRAWLERQDAATWRDAALLAVTVCLGGLLILRAWSRW